MVIFSTLSQPFMCPRRLITEVKATLDKLRVFYSMKCILFVLLLTSGSFSLLTKGQISVDLLKVRGVYKYS